MKNPRTSSLTMMNKFKLLGQMSKAWIFRRECPSGFGMRQSCGAFDAATPAESARGLAHSKTSRFRARGFPGLGRWLVCLGLVLACVVFLTLPAAAQSNTGLAYTFTTLAGKAGAGSADGTGDAAQFNGPAGIAVDGVGNLYVADSGNHTIRKVTSSGVVSTLAGVAGKSGS